MRLRNSTLDLEQRAQVMGILNVTPDSFSDGGLYFSPEAAVEQALRMEAAGADLIDIGGESTRPGAELISVEEELRRVVPVLEGLRGRLRIPVSIDTTRSQVAQRAVELGAEMINDISGLRFDTGVATVAATTGAALVLMHSRGTPATMQQLPPMSDLFSEVVDGLAKSIDLAQSAGVRPEKLVVDPGIGFGKTPHQNLQLINMLDRLVTAFGLPVLLGTSRKSFIRLSLDRLLPGRQASDTVDRLAGTAASLVIGLQRGARIFRVHDVPEAVAVLRLTESLLKAEHEDAEWAD
ncbi:MAG: dihydropteroate synthase [Acidobacteria bacterium]|nr:dihydropteroate synthase [Acidobacteriota bacterium]